MKLSTKKINNLLLITAIAVLMFACSISSEIQTYDYRNRTIGNVSDTLVDSSFIKILEPYKLILDDKMSIQIGMSNKALLKYRPESPLSNLLSDLILDYGIKYAESNLDLQPSICLLNHGGIRASLPEGPILIRNIFELMPFENEMVFLQLSGSQMIELCNYIASRGGEGVSGITFGMKNNMAFDIKIQGIGVDKNKNYWLVTNDYVASGGDGMKILTWAKEKVFSGIKIRDIFIEQIKALDAEGKMLNADIDKRIYYVE